MMHAEGLTGCLCFQRDCDRISDETELMNMGQSFYMDWEISLLEWMQKSLGSFGVTLAKVFSTLGSETFTLLILVAVIMCWKKQAGFRLAFNMLAASLWFPMIKNIVLRLRPYMVHRESVQALLPAEADADIMDVAQQGFSFPSGHSATATSLYGTLIREIRRKWIWIAGVALMLLIGISRLTVGVHYPTDVLAGWAVGLLGLAFGIWIEKKVPTVWIRFLILLCMGLPGVFWCTSRDYFSALGLAAGMTAAAWYEEKYVKYTDTRNPAAMILRAAGAFGIYLLLNKLLKLPFSEAFLNGGTLAANLVRTGRYAVIIFIALGLYPRVFPLFEKIGGKGAKS